MPAAARPASIRQRQAFRRAGELLAVAEPCGDDPLEHGGLESERDRDSRDRVTLAR